MIGGWAKVFELGHHRRYHRSRGSRSGIRSHDRRPTIHDVSRRTLTLALTRRGRLAVSVIGALALVAVGGIALALTGHAPAVIQQAVDKVTGATHEAEPPPTCPLTGMPAPHGEVPHRPVLAVKVENTPDAYPLAGLQRADVVYEELVEGGITRFMALYQCGDAKQVGPVRSARTTDPKVLIQYDPHSVIAYSGGAARCGATRSSARDSSATTRRSGGRRVLARRRTLHAAQPVREHRQAAREVGEGHGGGRAPAPAVPVRRRGADRR